MTGEQGHIGVMKVTSNETIEALQSARGQRNWDDYISTAPRTKDGAIIVKRPSGAVQAKARGGFSLFGKKAER